MKSGDSGGRIRSVVEAILPSRLYGGLLALWRRLYWWNRRRLHPGRTRRVVRKVLRRGQPIKLEIGSGPRAGLQDWVSLDIAPGATLRHDLGKPLPFPDACVDQIYSSHVLEHFAYPGELLALLRECIRVLRPGGKFSAAVPNARLYLEAYFDPAGFDRKTFCGFEVGLRYESSIDVVNFIAYLGGQHKFMFDEENLRRVVVEAGFREVRSRAYDAGLDMAERIHESIYVEAVK